MLDLILCLGDCNTLGAGLLKRNSYPERVAKKLDFDCRNFGHTMVTTREGLSLLEDNLECSPSHVTLQFGVVDSYQTFRYAPYVLYYPDSFFRKQYRSIVKKYKKICRKFGANERFGNVSVVPIKEYEENLHAMVSLCGGKTVILIETVPNQREDRNPAIMMYNKVLYNVAESVKNCRVLELYDVFYQQLDNWYLDTTHINGKGYEYISEQLVLMISE